MNVEKIKYKLLPNGYQISKASKTIKGDVVIPSEYNGFPVISIGKWAFFGCDKITSIIIPDSVIQVEEAAFHSCESMKEIILSENINSLPSLVFSDCTTLTNVTIPPNVYEIKDTVFRNCSSLSSIYIPSLTTKIDFTFVLGCKNLKKIFVDANNKLYYTRDGVLYIKGSNDYICVPQGIRGSVTLPDEIESVFGFADCKHLETVVLSNKTKLIEYGAFENCVSLKALVIPESVKCVDGMAFRGCDKLTIRIIGKHNIKDDWSVSWNESNCPVVWE